MVWVWAVLEALGNCQWLAVSTELCESCELEPLCVLSDVPTRHTLQALAPSLCSCYCYLGSGCCCNWFRWSRIPAFRLLIIWGHGGSQAHICMHATDCNRFIQECISSVHFGTCTRMRLKNESCPKMIIKSFLFVYWSMWIQMYFLKYTVLVTHHQMCPGVMVWSVKWRVWVFAWGGRYDCLLPSSEDLRRRVVSRFNYHKGVDGDGYNHTINLITVERSLQFIARINQRLPSSSRSEVYHLYFSSYWKHKLEIR